METNTAERLLAALIVLADNLETYKDQVGATNGEITAVEQYRDNLAHSLAMNSLIAADKQASTAIGQAVYNGSNNVKVGVYPPFSVTQFPFPLLNGGALTFYRELKARYKSAAGYTKEIGIALGLEKVASNPINPDLLIAAAILKNLGNYQGQGDFKKQGMNGMVFQYRVKGTEKWKSAGNALQSPFIFDIDAPATEGAAVEIEVRCRLLQGNTQVGSWSPIYSLTITS